MSRQDKEIIFSDHCLLRMKERDAAKEEVKEAIQEGNWQFADKGRLTSSKTFIFEKERNGRYYRSKEVAPVFVEENDKNFVITVYTFFSQGGK